MGRVGRMLLRAPIIALVLACAAEPEPPKSPESPGKSVTPQAPALDATPVKTFGKAYPIDEAPRDAAFAAFRDSLLQIVMRRDTSALFAIVAPEIKSSFGGDEGREKFRSFWRVSEADTELWTVLGDVLRHGGRFSGPDMFYAPYTFHALPDSLDAFEHLVVRDSDVVVRERPDSTGAALAMLSFDIVRAGPFAPEQAWRAIELVDGRVGYVRGDQIRSPVDYRAGFERRAGRWWLVFLVAGD